MNVESNEKVIEIVTELSNYMEGVDIECTAVYLRFVGDRTSIGTQIIYKLPNEDKGVIPSVFQKSRSVLMDVVGPLFCDLQDEIEKEKGVKFCVALLKLGNDSTYKIHFEYKDMKKWSLDKMDGKTGIPDLKN